MSWYNTDICKSKESTIKFGSNSYEKVKAVEKVCRLIIDKKVLTPDDIEPVRHGRWDKVYKSGVTVTDGHVSSCCDMWNERRSPWCPNCGAKMDLEKEGI